jgi:hypothetical protein
VPSRPQKNASNRRSDCFFDEKMRILSESPSSHQPNPGTGVVRWLARGAFGVSLFSGANLAAAELPLEELIGGTAALGTESSSVLPEYPDLTLGLATGLADGDGSQEAGHQATPPSSEPKIKAEEATTAAAPASGLSPETATEASGLSPETASPPQNSGITPASSAADAAPMASSAVPAEGESASSSPSVLESVGSSYAGDPSTPANQDAGKPWSVSLFFGATYDDNIRFAGAGEDESSDVIFNTGVSAGYRLPGSGLFQSLSMTAGASYQSYLDSDDLSGWNYNAGLTGGRNIGDLSLSGSLFASQMNSADRWAGNFATRQSYGASLSAAYSLTGKIRLVTNGGWNAFEYDGDLLGTQSWNVSAGFDYEFSPKLRGGINYGWSTFEQDGYDNRGWSNINFTAAWQASPKTGFSASFGPQIGNFNGSIDSGPGWIASLSGNWQATDRTSVALGLNRNMTGSPVDGGSSISFTTVSLSVSQGITDRLSGSAAIAYQTDDFNADEEGAFGGRQDDFFSVTASLSWRFTTRASLTAFYEFRDNSSNTQGVDFSNNRIGCQLSVQF